MDKLTASNIAMEEDEKNEEANNKKSKVDVAKIEAEINANKELAAKVGFWLDLVACTLRHSETSRTDDGHIERRYPNWVIFFL